MEEAFAAIKRAALPKRRLLVPTPTDAAGANLGISSLLIPWNGLTLLHTK
jgi:hypothetical protein